MKKIINISFFIGMLFLLVGKASAQKGELKMNIDYNHSIPVGSFKTDLISNSLASGFNAGIMYSINYKWAFGLQSGYQYYYQKYLRAIYNISKTQQVSAVLTNTVETTPVMFKALFTPLGGTKSFVQPYISAGAGMDVVTLTQYLGEFGSADNSASFAAQAGLGLRIPFGRFSASGFKIGATYNYIPYNKNGFSELNTVDLQAGIYFKL